MIDNLTVDKSLLTRYEEKVSELKLAMKASSVKPNSAIDKLKDFFEEYFKESYQKHVLDSQNFYFAKQATRQFIELVRENIDSVLSDTDYEKYVSEALKKVDLSKYLLSKTSIDKIKKDASSYFKSILDIIDFNFGAKTKQNNQASNERNVESKKTRLAKNAENFVKRNLSEPEVNLAFISGFLKANVFSNFSKILHRQTLAFDKSSITLIDSKKTGFKVAFTKLWVPPLKTLNRSFRHFERSITFGITHRVRRSFKKLGKSVYGTIDSFFPLTFFTGIFKISKFIVGTGLKLIKGVLHLGVSVISKSLHFAFSGIKFVTGLTLKIGVGAVKLMTKTLSKIGVFKAFKFTAKILFGFLKSYPGAYLLGYVVGTIYRNFKAITDFANDLFKRASDAFNEHVYKPFIAPIIDWFQGSKFDFYLREILQATKDGLSVEDIDSLFAIKDVHTGRSILDSKTISNDIDKATSAVTELINNATFDNLVYKVAMPLGGSILGGALGSKFGAALGFAVAGPVGSFIGGALGYLAGLSFGGEVGEQLGNLFIDKGGFTEVKRSESRFQQIARESMGSSDVVENVYFDIGKSRTIEELSEIGRSAAEISFHAPTTPGESDALMELASPLISKGLLSQQDISSIREGNGPFTLEAFQTHMEEFSRISSLNYNAIHAETNNAFGRLNVLLNDKMHKGFIMGSMVADSDYTSNLTLHESGVLRIPRRVGGKLVNPFWFKAIRAAELQNLVVQLAHGQISIVDFFKEYDIANNPELLAKKYGDRKLFSNGVLGDALKTANELIFPHYAFNDANKQRLAGWIGNVLAFEFNPSDIDAFKKSLPKVVQNNIERRLREESGNFSFNDWFKSQLFGPLAPAFQAAQKIQPHWTIPVEEAVKWYGSEWAGKNDLMFLAPGDFTQSYVGRNVDEHLAKLDISNFLNLRTSYRGGTADRYASNVSALRNNQTFMSTFERALSEMSEDYINLTNLNDADKDEILRRFLLEMAQNGISDVEQAAQSENFEAVLRQSILASNRAIGLEETDSRNVGQFVEANIGRRFESIETALMLNSNVSEEDLRTAIDSIASSGQISEIRTMLDRYNSLGLNNNEFLQERILPFLRLLKEKGFGEDVLRQMAGNSLFIAAFPPDEQRNPTDAVAGEAAAPDSF